MANDIRNKTFKSVAYATMGIGIAYVIARHRHNVLNFFSKAVKLVKSDPYSRKCIVVVQNEEHCKIVTEVLRKKCSELNVLGFDCEWVTEHNVRRPVALVQLASQDGLCALFRICKFKKVPQSLKKILEDKNILKVGVAPLGDAKYLLNDYGVQMRGCVDLRFLARDRGVSVSSLSALSGSVLGQALDKDWRVVCSNWEADALNTKQQEYAARDALAGILIFIALLRKGQPLWQLLFQQKNLKDVASAAVHQYINVQFSNKSGSGTQSRSSHKSGYKTSSRNLSSVSHKAPYDNCVLLSPAGELIAPIPRRKAQWYLTKGLATEVSTDPVAVQLNFEPSQRDGDGTWDYYKQLKENLCVVCGSTKSFLKKHIVPLEYRKYFPEVMKKGRSHDVLVLCSRCHVKSNNVDYELRSHLAELCGADLHGPKTAGTRTLTDIVHSFAKALSNPKCKEMIPLEKKTIMLNTIQEYCGSSVEVTSEILENLSKLNPNENTKSCHAKRVVEYFTQSDICGLLELERMWREHFLKALEPKFLPPLWSVHHGHSKLADKLKDCKPEISSLNQSIF